MDKYISIQRFWKIFRDLEKKLEKKKSEQRDLKKYLESTNIFKDDFIQSINNFSMTEYFISHEIITKINQNKFGPTKKKQALYI